MRLWGILLAAIGVIGACQSQGKDAEKSTSRARHGAGDQNAGRFDYKPFSIDPSSIEKKPPHVLLKRIETLGAVTASESERSSYQTVRVVMHFDAEAAYRRSELPAMESLSKRVIVDLELVRLDSKLNKVVSVARGGLRRIRAFQLSEATARVSFDVDDATHCRIFHLTHPYRVVIDFFLSNRSAKGERRVAGYRTIVLDPGHGGEQPGARGPDGLKESVLTLDLAKRIYRGLRREIPDDRIVLTRESDRYMSLEERTAIANGYAADLFLSIHFNGSASQSDKGGVSTFVLDTSDDEQAIKLAALENVVSQREVTRLQQILASLCRAEQVGQSLKLAGHIHRETLASGRKMLPHLADRGIRRALFFVLVGARMPAVLLEASFLTRPEEAAALKTDRYRQLLAEGVVRGIVRFLKSSKNQ
ncbi:MAG: N-acetylmuramoyl-L-alanine amidase [Deltaproteobacteria bacterium]|nr:N-acetylmuramoyl-L-alanine amidase [Deltaproteobacteria bacterium]